MAVTSGPSISLDSDHAIARPLAQPRSLWAPSLPLALGLAMFVFFNNATGLPLLGDPDSHWHVALGNWILTHGTVPTVDTFSFTFAGQPWIAKEWLSQVLMAVAFNLGGWGGVTALASAALAITFALLLRLLLRDLRPLPALLMTVAAAIMTAPHFLARPHILAFPFILWWVAGLVRAVEERRAPQPLLLVAMLFWANMHGGFTLGLVLAGALALDALVGARDNVERRALFIGWARFGIAAALVACITPYGPESILVTLRIFGLGDALSVISEWRSPDFQNQVSQELVLLVALYLALSRGVKLPLIRLLIVIGLVHLFLRYARNAELLATLAPLVIAPVLARQFPALVPDAQVTKGLAGRLNALARPAGAMALALAVAVGALFAGVMIRLGSIEPPSSNMPAAALAYARDNGIAGGRVLNHYNFGGYLIRAGVPTFIDGRGELYGGDFIKKYAHAVNLKGDESFETVLDRYQIDWTLLTPEQPANQLLSHLPGWRRAYADEAAVIYVRQK